MRETGRHGMRTAFGLLDTVAVGLVLCVVLTGCSAQRTSLQVGPVLRYEGKVEATFCTPIGQVHEAVLRALGARSLPRLEDHLDVVTGRVVSRTPAGASVRVELTALGPGHTRVIMREDTPGEGEERAEHLLEHVHSLLRVDALSE